MKKHLLLLALLSHSLYASTIIGSPVVEINSEGLIKVIQKDNFNEIVSEKDLADTIISIYKNKKIDKVYIKGDKTIEYEKVIRLISILNKGGVENIGLITLPVNEYQ